MVVDHVLHNGQPQTGSTRFARPGGVASIEALKDSLQVAVGDSLPLVGHRNFYQPVFGRGAHANPGGAAGIGDGVAHQIVNRSGQGATVAQNIGTGSRRHCHRDPRLLGQHRISGNRLLDDGIDGHHIGVLNGANGLKPG